MSLPQLRYKVQMGGEIVTVTSEQMSKIRDAVDSKTPLVSIGGREYRTYLFKKSWPIEDKFHQVNDEPTKPGINHQGLRKIQMCQAAVGLRSKAEFSSEELLQVAEIRQGYLERKAARKADPEAETKREFNREIFDVDFASFEDKRRAYEQWKKTQAAKELVEESAIDPEFNHVDAAIAIFGVPEGEVYEPA